MSRKDYANKPKPRQSATRTQAAPKRKSPPPQSAGVSGGLVFAVIIALAILGGLIFFLLKQPAPTTKPAANATAQPKIEANAEPRQPGQSLPLDNIDLGKEGDERFGFYKLLQESEVKTPEESAYTSTPKSASLDGVYRLQTGSFRQASDAEAQRAKLALQGLPNVTTSLSEGSNGTWYRVSTGPFTTYSELKKALTKLDKLNIHPVQKKVK